MATLDASLQAIDLDAAAPDGVVAIPEGSGAVVWGDDPTDGRWLDAVDGVAGSAPVRVPGRPARVVWADPGRWFALPEGLEHLAPFEPGTHGGAWTRDQVAVVGGGHPAAAAVADAVRRRDRRVDGADWAPTIAALLGFDLPAASGRSLA
jgi:hypothetical protein